MGEIKVCNNKTRFYQGKLSHFEKHLGDYISVILSLQQKPVKKYEDYISSINSSVTALSKMIPQLRKCKCHGQRSDVARDDVQHLHFYYGKDETGDKNDKAVNIEKIKSIIKSTG